MSTFDSKIESTKTVYLDDQEFVRVFFGDSEYFEDVPVENFENWKEATGNYEKK